MSRKPKKENSSTSLRIRIEDPDSLKIGIDYLRSIEGNENLSDQECIDHIFSLHKAAGIIMQYILDNPLIINGMNIESEGLENQRLAA